MTGYSWISVDMRALARPSEETSRAFLRELRFTPGWREDVPTLAWTMPETGAPDWVSTIELARLVSDRARAAVEPLLGTEDCVQWLPATLTTYEGDTLAYWVMHFPEPFDPYDERRTVRGPSGIPLPGRAVVSRARTAGRDVIAPQLEAASLLVSDRMLTGMLDARLTGWDCRIATVA
ncbi:hypothetical protein GXP71_13910 [Cellulomonas sp. H30R-01]|uniref:hypothetical protein n=1 Tax=Cellulomonas sp. H30R-01 TaxID=2704467 RepID=UPI00138D9B23|nr:hypothetical protein [Cellulomonas sp. H30R-01]QHT57066.1 hypothetical protein GXP71_13910 [Cellulomonas sp. H30R-01]